MDTDQYSHVVHVYEHSRMYLYQNISSMSCNTTRSERFHKYYEKVDETMACILRIMTQ